VLEPDFEVIRRAWEATNRGDEEAVRRAVHPDIEAVPFGAALEGARYRGIEEVVGWWRQTLASWEVWHIHAEEFRRVGDRILVTGKWHVRGKGSGVELDMPATWIIEVRDGKIAFWRTYTDRGQALEELGLDA
jgi:ketosteroid isomerase-like protein